ncbi:MAG TPA: MBL fold metallo-hydrolase [Actinocrinis sp.]|jgi:glyoxylase-like metal-dependent hydrolase (beta-lactamase superfamily II)
MSQNPDTPVDFAARTPVAGDLDVRWIHGSRRRSAAPDPPIQVHAYNEHTVILRQSKAVHYEAPFMFLLFGNHRAMLLDTGATPEPERFPLRATVDRLIESWLAAHPRSAYALVVAHTHGHGDHVAADAQFADRPDTTIVGRDPEAVRSFFGFGEAWPAEQVGYDLGGRVLQIIGAPGHQQAAIVFYDPYTGILLTGDTVLPGRLYARDFPVFADTVERLAAFAEAHPVSHVLGCHVEMTNRPGRDYPLGARYQPDERPLPMTVAQLAAVRDAVRQAGTHAGVYAFDDFVVYHLPSRTATLRLVCRGLVNRVLLRR